MRPENDLADKPHPLAHATLIVSGSGVVPEFWTTFFGVEPTWTVTKGKPFKTPSGRMNPRLGKLGLWAFGSKPHVTSDHLAPHLIFLQSRLSLPRRDARALAEAQGATIALWCYWCNHSGDRVPDIPPFAHEMMEAMGGMIEIDEYR
ncbi:DUF4279 domain-containing protein [Caballeronia sp. LZ035]|uniref:DUF4279 domain-containing protein n=1 Tax=Caballeronia sp. LZ035 TaxID=3038568 RepID=UPI002861611C|nr:DUF4279 domain-containing protein [Caballeronia sp. LZ035]MDR5756628.1 DUF4279 domain-containing protein [Caballeronia sp. LZ035]